MHPLGIVALAGGVASTVAFVRRPSRRRRTMLQFAAAMTSWSLLWFATASHFAELGMMSLPDHMIGHVLVMFAIPMGLIVSSTGRSWVWLLGVHQRRRLLRWWHCHRRLRCPRFRGAPVLAAVTMNTVMVAAHVPAIFDWIMVHNGAMDWLMEPAFLLSGLFFFHYLIPAWPHRITVRLRVQFLMVAATMVEMLIVAMAMSIFSSTNWYSVMLMPSMPTMPYMPGMGLSPAVAFHQQQLAAAILWICGDFWAVPCLVLIVRRLVLRDGSILGALERHSAKVSGSVLD